MSKFDVVHFDVLGKKAKRATAYLLQFFMNWGLYTNRFKL